MSKSFRDLTILEWMSGETVPVKNLDMGIEFKDTIWSLADHKEELDIYNKNIIMHGDVFPENPAIGQIVRKGNNTYIYRGEGNED